MHNVILFPMNKKLLILRRSGSQVVRVDYSHRYKKYKTTTNKPSLTRPEVSEADPQRNKE